MPTDIQLWRDWEVMEREGGDGETGDGVRGGDGER